ncbi:MAG: DUF4956 domain-containing protein [Pseudomonadota bacterium]
MTSLNLEQITLFGNTLVNYGSLGELVLKFGIDLLVIYIIIRWIFYPLYRQKNFFFSYFLINISVFLVCALLSSIQLKIGFAFGLFAVFSIIRYRTEQIPIREMTYLFVTIIVGVINALSTSNISYAEILFSNIVIVVSIYMLEKKCLPRGVLVKRVRYEKIELIDPTRREEIIKDLRQRTGLDVVSIDVDDVDFLNDTANLKVFYKENRNKKK